MKEKNFSKQNRKRLVSVLSVPVLLALLILILKLLPPFHCPFRTYCHFLCVGCGITRAFSALMRGHIKESVLFNPAAVVLAITGILYYIEQWCMVFGKKVTLFARNKRFWLVLAGIYLVYCILRNIPALAFLTWA